MDSPTIDLATLIEGYRLSCQTEGKSPKTVEWYTSFLLRFTGFLESVSVPTAAAQIDRNHIRAFIGYLQTEARTPRGNMTLSRDRVLTILAVNCRHLDRCSRIVCLLPKDNQLVVHILSLFNLN